MSTTQTPPATSAANPELVTVNRFPHAVREIENEWITMPDGVKLAARIWLPEDAHQQPVPAIVEYLPYRKRDGTVTRDTMAHAYYAGHGYAGVRVDMRGCGDSEGVLHDEYTQQELDDGVSILRWLEQQPWCDGNCGMMGISWGGFNGLQIAALQPPQLKAIVTICSTDDRYADDVHYMGGCLLGDNLSWASTMLGYMTSPPDPEIVGERWREMWMERLEEARPWLKPWLTHQTRDSYWKHGSVCEDYSKIETPVMAVSGWSDPYTNSVFRLLKNLPEALPRMGLVGPWGHKYPHIGRPGPAIGFLQETLRWWDRHLKGIDTGIDSESMLRVYVQDSMPPSTGYKHRLGRWVAEPSWPSPNIEERDYPLISDRYSLGMNPDGTTVYGIDDASRRALSVSSPFSLGYFGGKWCGESAPPDLPDDQREDDGGALVFDSPPLDEPLEILGSPIVELDLESDRPIAMVAVRLSDVLPDGRVTRLTYGLLNLTHREGNEQPRALEPHQRYRVQVPLNYLAQRFTPGHRLRVAISSSYWPLAWLPPEQTTLKIHTENSQVTLPIRNVQGDELPVHFERPEAAPATKAKIIAPTEKSWKVIRDIASGRSALEVRKGRGRQYWREIDWERSSVGFERYAVDHDEILSASGEVKWSHWFARGDWSARIETRTHLTGDHDNFHLQVDVDAYHNDERIFCRSWNHKIRRDGV